MDVYVWMDSELVQDDGWCNGLLDGCVCGSYIERQVHCHVYMVDGGWSKNMNRKSMFLGCISNIL